VDGYDEFCNYPHAVYKFVDNVVRNVDKASGILIVRRAGR